MAYEKHGKIHAEKVNEMEGEMISFRRARVAKHANLEKCVANGQTVKVR